MKQHLAGILGQISSCKKVSRNVCNQMQQLLKENKEKNKSNELDEAYNDHIIEEEVQEVEPYTNVGKSKTSTTTQK